MDISSRFTAYGGLLGLGLLGLASFSWLPDSFFRMVSWPWVLVWQGAFGLVLASCLWHLRRFNQPFYRLGFGFDWLAVGLFVCLTLSSLAAPFPLLALQYSFLVSCYVVLLYGLYNSRYSSLQLCEGLVWVGAIAAIISLILWRPTPEMWLSDNFYDAIRNRFPLGHHNFTGGYFVLVLPIAAGLAWLHSGWRRWGYGGLSLVIVIALYASGSRGAWLGGIALLAPTLGTGILRSGGRIRLRAITLSGLAVCLLLVLLGSNPRIRSLILVFKLPETSNTEIVIDGPTQDRFFMAQAAFNILKDRPISGLGPGNLGRVYERYRPLTTGTGLNQVQQLHNTPLQIVVELGLGGLLLYGGTLLCLSRLGWQLQQQSSPKDRRLSRIILAGFLGYGISSLSDYQLENIPIALTLLVLLVSFIKLGKPFTVSELPKRLRRWCSIGLLVILALLIQFWLRSNLALWMTQQGITSIQYGNFSRADNKFYTAATLAPWDPTPSALGAQQLSDLAQVSNDESRNVLQKEAITLYQRLLTVAPNDIWFNQNIAVLAWQTGDIATAHQAIAKVVQLSPRSRNYSYYLLGLTYQSMGNIDAAITAFALECLINPQTLLLESWDQTLAPLRDAVFSQVLQHCQIILSELQATHPLSNSLKNHIYILRWWFDEADLSPPDSEIRLLLQALLAIEKAPDQATALLDRCTMDVSEDAKGCRLLKAWLQPQYLSEYLATTKLEDQEILQSQITTHRNIRNWLRASTTPIFGNQRVAMALLYRSYYAQKISSILIPENLQQFSLPSTINLFSLTWPREFLPLDNLIETVRTDSLGLPHPTRNNFQFTHPSDLATF